MHRPSGDGRPPRRGQGQHHQQRLEDRTTSATPPVTAALALAVGLISHVLRELGDPLLHQPRADGLAGGLLRPPLANSQNGSPAARERPQVDSASAVYYRDEDVSGGNSRKANARRAASQQARVSETSTRLRHFSLVQGHPGEVSSHSSTAVGDHVERPHRRSPFTLPRSRSEPSRYLLRPQFQLELDEDERREPLPSPPRSPLSDESLHDYLMMCYEKWMSHHSHGHATGAPVWDASLRGPGYPVLQQMSAGLAEDERSPRARMPQHLRRAAGRHTPEEIRSYVSNDPRNNPQLNNLQDYVERYPMSEDSESATSPAFDEFFCQDGHVGDDDTTVGNMPLPTRRRSAPLRWPTSAPSPCMGSRGALTHSDMSRDNWDYRRPIQRAASVVWSSGESGGSPEALHEQAQPTQKFLAPTSQTTGTHTGGSGRRSSGPQGSFRSRPSQQEGWYDDTGLARNSADKRVSTTSGGAPQRPVQPVQMTIQFYNQSSNGATERAPLHVPPEAGNIQGKAREKKTLRQKSTPERTTLPSGNLTKPWAGPVQSGTPAYHTVSPTVDTPIQVRGPDGRLTETTHARYAAQHFPVPVHPSVGHRSSLQQAAQVATHVKQGGASGSAHQQASPFETDKLAMLTGNVATSSSTLQSKGLTSRLPVLQRRSSSLSTPVSMPSLFSAPRTLKSLVSGPDLSCSSVSLMLSEDDDSAPLNRQTSSPVSTNASHTSARKKASSSYMRRSRAPAAEEESPSYSSTRASSPQQPERQSPFARHPLHRSGDVGESSRARSQQRAPRAGQPHSEQLMPTMRGLQQAVTKGDSSGPLSSDGRMTPMPPAFHHDGETDRRGVLSQVPARGAEGNSYYSHSYHRLSSAPPSTAEYANYYATPADDDRLDQPVEDEFTE